MRQRCAFKRNLAIYVPHYYLKYSRAEIPALFGARTQKTACFHTTSEGQSPRTASRRSREHSTGDEVSLGRDQEVGAEAGERASDLTSVTSLMVAIQAGTPDQHSAENRNAEPDQTGVKNVMPQISVRNSGQHSGIERTTDHQAGEDHAAS